MAELAAAENGEIPEKRGRGRPRKIRSAAEMAEAAEKPVARQKKSEGEIFPAEKAARGRAAKAVSWPAERVERWPIGKLVENTKNARKHSSAQVDQIVAVIRKFGFTSPILVAPDGNVIAGRGRLMALRRLGAEEVPVIVARGWSKAKQRAFAIADNQLALNSEWDEEVLRVELHDLKAQDVDIGMLGFAGKDLDRLLAADLAQGEKVSEPGKAPVLNSVIQYNIVFETEAQQKKWFEFIRWLKVEFPEESTTASRFTAYYDTLDIAEKGKKR